VGGKKKKKQNSKRYQKVVRSNNLEVGKTRHKRHKGLMAKKEENENPYADSVGGEGNSGSRTDCPEKSEAEGGWG